MLHIGDVYILPIIFRVCQLTVAGCWWFWRMYISFLFFYYLSAALCLQIQQNESYGICEQKRTKKHTNQELKTKNNEYARLCVWIFGWIQLFCCSQMAHIRAQCEYRNVHALKSELLCFTQWYATERNFPTEKIAMHLMGIKEREQPAIGFGCFFQTANEHLQIMLGIFDQFDQGDRLYLLDHSALYWHVLFFSWSTDRNGNGNIEIFGRRKRIRWMKMMCARNFLNCWTHSLIEICLYLCVVS